jgi:hypothetical protein
VLCNLAWHTKHMGRRARTNPAKLRGLENKNKSGQRRGIFLDSPFYQNLVVWLVVH